MSSENATILINSSRWPLMIDPQLQGIKWIKNKYGENLIVLRLTQKYYLDKIEHAIANGDIVLLENITETIDAVLDPIIGRVLIKKGRYVLLFSLINKLLDQIDLVKLNANKGLSRWETKRWIITHAFV